MGWPVRRLLGIWFCAVSIYYNHRVIPEEGWGWRSPKTLGESCQAMLLSQSFIRTLKLPRMLELFKNEEEDWDWLPVACLSDCERIM